MLVSSGCESVRVMNTQRVSRVGMLKACWRCMVVRLYGIGNVMGNQCWDLTTLLLNAHVFGIGATLTQSAHSLDNVCLKVETNI